MGRGTKCTPNLAKPAIQCIYQPVKRERFHNWVLNPIGIQHYHVNNEIMFEQDPDQQRRAWARSSLGVSKKLGRSYSVKSMDQKKLAMPVMSRKRWGEINQFSIHPYFVI